MSCVNLIRKADYSEAEVQQTIENLYANYEIVRVDKQDIVKASQKMFCLCDKQSLLLLSG